MCQFIFTGNGGLMDVWTGINVDWLKDERTALLILSIITSWSHVGTAFLLLLAGFRGVSEDIQEAAIVDGAGEFTRAVKIMIPMASPQIFYVVFTNILSAIKTFTQIRLLTSGGPGDSTRTLMYQIYTKGAEAGQYEYACCASVIMFLIIFIITRIQFKFEDKLVHYQ
jgi:sn-glycerol 3-phosphate transport system permease protein